MVKRYEEKYRGTNFKDNIKEYYKDIIKNNPYVDIDTYKRNKNACIFYKDIEKFLNYQNENIINIGSFKHQATYLDSIVLSNNSKNSYLRTDQFGFSFDGENAKDDEHPYGKYFNMISKLSDKNYEKELVFIANCINDTRTIGGCFIWPIINNKNGNWSSIFNSSRGIKSYIEDRVDLTLYEIKMFYELYKEYGDNYENIKTEMKNNNFILLKGKDAKKIYDWLISFKTFKKYVEFFCFEDNFVKDEEIIDIINSDIKNSDIKNLKDKDVEDYINKVKENKNNKVLASINNNQELLNKILSNVRLLTLKRSKKIEKIIYNVKVIDFDKTINRNEIDNIGFININNSLNNDEIEELLKDAIKEDDLVFIVSNNISENVINNTAKIVKELSAFAVGIGLKDKLLPNLNKYVDAIVSIPSDNLKDITNINNITLDSTLYYTIKSIADIISFKGIINIDLKDIKTLFKNGRNSLVTIGSAFGGTRAIDSTQKACNKLTNKDFTDIIISIVSDNSLTNFEIEDIVETVRKNVNNENINILFQVILDNKINKNKEVIVTLIALY